MLRKLGHRAWFSRIARTFVPLDRTIGRLSRGRYVVLGMRELPSFLITTTGRRTGRPRTVALLYTTDGENFVVIGSNFGQRHHPAWSANLLAQPTATVTVQGQEILVRAELVSGAERARLWQLALQRWPAYATYEQQAAHRKIRIFLLRRSDEPA
jgi:deazaflavin-dependent oxidoreductase (nitroreductase family)